MDKKTMVIIDQDELDEAINMLDRIYTELRGINESFKKLVEMVEDERGQDH